MACGAIILREGELYTWTEMGHLAAYMGLCVLGVILLVRKIRVLNRALASSSDIELVEITPIISNNIVDNQVD